MKTLLQIHSSLNGRDSLSSRLAREFVADWQRGNADGRVVERDLARDSVPHLTAQAFAAFAGPVADEDEVGAAALAQSDVLIAELRAADVIVLAVPMYNFGVPSTLKAWIDYVARAGQTFRYGPHGPVGLLKDKRAIVFATRGGAYAGSPRDTQTAYLSNLLGFLGIDDIEFVYAEQTALGEETRAVSVGRARQRIDELAAQFAA